MAKLTRIFQNLFGRDGNQSHFGQFGSRVSAPPGFNTKDPASIQALSAFITNGWLDAINGSNKAPFLEDMNGVFFLIFYQICQLFQDGIAVWDPSTPYFTGSVVRKDGTFELYGSLTDNNVGNALPNQTANANWTFLNPPVEQAGFIKAFAGGSAPFGFALCNGQTFAEGAQPNLFAAIGHTWDSFRGQAVPGGNLFRVPALQGLTLIGAGGALGITSARALADVVGEEAHVLTVAELAQHSHTTAPHHHFKQFGAPGGGDNNFAMNPTASGAGQNTDDTTVGVNNTGGNGAHNNMQPSGAINWCIKL